MGKNLACAMVLVVGVAISSGGAEPPRAAQAGAAPTGRVPESPRGRARREKARRGHGRFQWTNAPLEVVVLNVENPAEGQKVRFFGPGARDSEIVVTMPAPFRLRGKVVDAETGRPIDRFRLIRVSSGPTISHRKRTRARRSGLSAGATRSPAGATRSAFPG